MSDNVITLPVVRIERDGQSEEEWQDSLYDLHERLSTALTKDRKQIDLIRMALSIDDVMSLCQLIEEKLSAECFDDE